MNKILGLGEEKGHVGRKKSMVRVLALGFPPPPTQGHKGNKRRGKNADNIAGRDTETIHHYWSLC